MKKPNDVTIDRHYEYRAPCVRFSCSSCGAAISGRHRHSRIETHSTVNGQRIGRTYFFHRDCYAALPQEWKSAP